MQKVLRCAEYKTTKINNLFEFGTNIIQKSPNAKRFYQNCYLISSLSNLSFDAVIFNVSCYDFFGSARETITATLYPLAIIYFSRILQEARDDCAEPRSAPPSDTLWKLSSVSGIIHYSKNSSAVYFLEWKRIEPIREFCTRKRRFNGLILPPKGGINTHLVTNDSQWHGRIAGPFLRKFCSAEIRLLIPRGSAPSVCDCISKRLFAFISRC